jgi:hypothetical protein
VDKIQAKINLKTAREAPKGPVHKETMNYCENEIRPLLVAINIEKMHVQNVAQKL